MSDLVPYLLLLVHRILSRNNNNSNIDIQSELTMSANFSLFCRFTLRVFVTFEQTSVLMSGVHQARGLLFAVHSTSVRL